MSGTIFAGVEADGAAVATAALSRRYGTTAALDGVDLVVPRGAVYLLVGPNGAGKSTLLKLLLGLLRADAGTARVFGLDPAREPALVRAQVGYVAEANDIPYGWLTVGELMEHHAAYFPAWDAEYARWLAMALELEPAKKWRSLSKGFARRVQLLLALAHRPPLLLLDEPTDALDPLVRDRVLGLLADHVAASPTTVLWSTHHVHEADRLADHLGVIRGGRLVAQAHRDELPPRAAPLPGPGARGVGGGDGAERAGAAPRGGAARDRLDGVGRRGGGGGRAGDGGRRGARGRAAVAGGGRAGAAGRARRRRMRVGRGGRGTVEPVGFGNGRRTG